MSEWRPRFQVARWEFERFAKPNQILVSLVIMLLLGAGGYGLAKWAKRGDSDVSKVAVIGGAPLGLDRPDTLGGIALAPGSVSQLDSLRGALRDREIAGILMLDGTESGRLIVRRDPPWRRALEGHVSEARQRLQLERSGMSRDELASLLAPVSVSVEYQGGTDGRSARIAAVVATSLVLYGVIMSMAYMLVSVTAEKQLRVTEQVISAVSPQTWMDGKVLGLAAIGIVNVLTAVAGIVVWMLGRSIATGSRLSFAITEPATLMWIVVFALLGFIFWLAVFGVVAATIDDPNTSARGPLMMLPFLFSAAGFMIIGNPDSMFAQIASQVPLTSWAVIPARLALTEVMPWELLLSATLLIAGALVARKVAGRVFAVAMLMYGKEPSWREIRRWAVESGS